MMNKHPRPWIIAHRGARDEAPENTITAFDRALRYPVEGVEFDVQMSADGALVLYHDHTLLKVGGGRRKIPDLWRTDLEKIDWGKWFHPSFAGEELPTLERALSLVNRCSQMCIEIKSDPRAKGTAYTDRLTARVVECVNRTSVKRFKDRILILSFDPEVLISAHKMDHDLRYVLNLWEADPPGSSMPTDHLWAVDARISHLTESLAQWARRKHLRLFTYTCNGPRQIRKALQLEVDAIITDRPDWLADHLGRHKKAPGAP